MGTKYNELVKERERINLGGWDEIYYRNKLGEKSYIEKEREARWGLELSSGGWGWGFEGCNVL
jgi:hypothetical protein